MTFNEYGKCVDETAIYPTNQFPLQGLMYCALGLNGEAGEIAEKMKKIIRDKDCVISQNDAIEMALELGDQLWYITRLAKHLGFTLEGIAIMNVDKLASRMERGKLKGNGDNR